MNSLIRLFRFSSLVLAALTPLAVSAQNHKISADVANAAANGPVQVIVQYNSDPGKQLESLLTVKHHGILRNTLHSIHAHAATLHDVSRRGSTKPRKRSKR